MPQPDKNKQNPASAQAPSKLPPAVQGVRPPGPGQQSPDVTPVGSSAAVGGTSAGAGTRPPPRPPIQPPAAALSRSSLPANRQRRPPLQARGFQTRSCRCAVANRMGRGARRKTHRLIRALATGSRAGIATFHIDAGRDPLFLRAHYHSNLAHRRSHPGGLGRFIFASGARDDALADLLPFLGPHRVHRLGRVIPGGGDSERTLGKTSSGPLSRTALTIPPQYFYHPAVGFGSV